MSSLVIKKLLQLSGFCIVLEVFRLLTTETLVYIFLPFNLILAWIPLGFATLASKQEKNWKFFICFIAWLVFFPNAPYIITDLIHLKARSNFPL